MSIQENNSQYRVGYTAVSKQMGFIFDWILRFACPDNTSVRNIELFLGSATKTIKPQMSAEILPGYSSYELQHGCPVFFQNELLIFGVAHETTLGFSSEGMKKNVLFWEYTLFYARPRIGLSSLIRRK